MSSVICPGALAKPAHLSFPGPLVYHRDHRFVIFCQCPTNHLSPKHCLPKGSKGILKYWVLRNSQHKHWSKWLPTSSFFLQNWKPFRVSPSKTCSWGSKRLSKLCLTDATDDFNPGCALQWNGSYNGVKNNGSTIYTAMVHIFGYYIYIYLEHATFIHFKAVLKVWNEDPSQTFANDSITKLHTCCLEWCSQTCRMTVVSASDIFMDQQHDHSYRKKLHHPWQVITCGFRISHLINLDLILGRAVAASWDKEEAPNRYVPITLYYIAFNCFPIAFNCF